jgi:prephenate dehydrogenase
VAQRIAIIGLGLIGGSIGLALKRADLKGAQVAGVARSRETTSKARKLGAIDIDARTPAEAVEGARLVIVAAPILSFPQIFDDITPTLDPGAIVTDAASTKSMVARWAKERLPEHVHFVGGHPMAGKEFSGIEHADADLFRGKPWVIAPSVEAPEAAVNTVIGLAQVAGAEPIFMDPQEHDAYVAAISHLPLTVAAALFSVAFGSAAWPELASLASSGFRDTTRLASGSPEMAHDIMQTNREQVLHWLDRLQGELTRFRDVIAKGDSKEIAATFSRAQIERDNYMVNGPPRRESGEPMPKVSLGDFLLGSKLTEFMRKQEEIIRASEERANKRR